MKTRCQKMSWRRRLALIIGAGLVTFFALGNMCDGKIDHPDCVVVDGKLACP